MVMTICICWLIAFAIVMLVNIASNVHLPSTSSSSNMLYGECGELYNKPLSLISPHNTASEITRKDGLFYVTIENSITGDKKTLSKWDKWLLCLEAEDVAFQFAVKERNEYHTC